MVLTFGLSINGVDYINYADYRTIRPVDSLRDRSDTMSGLELRISFDGNTPQVPIPKSGAQIILTRGISGEGQVREFGGVITRVKETQISPRVMKYTLSCADFIRWFDRYLLVAEYLAVDYPTAGAMVRKIVADSANKGSTDPAYPITWDTSLVTDGITIPDQKFDYVQPSAAIDQIAKLIGYRWDLDYYGRLVFLDPAAASNVAPIAVINCETDVTSQTIGDIEIEDAADQVVNVVYIKNAKAPGQPYIEPLATGNGTQQFFSLGFEPASLSTTRCEVTASGTTKVYDSATGTLLYEGLAGKPGDTRTDDVLYLCLPNWGIRFNPGHAPVNNANVKVTYTPLDSADTVYERVDYNSIKKMVIREHTVGRYEEVMDAGDLKNATVDSINARGDLILLQNQPKLLISCRTINTTGWTSGQRLTVVSTKRMGGINKTFYVIEVNKSILSPSVMAYDLRLADDIYGEL